MQPAGQAAFPAQAKPGEPPILPLLFSLLLLGAILYLLGWFKKGDQGWLTGWARQSTGILFVSGAAFLATRNIGLAIFAGMLSYSAFSRLGLFQTKRPGGNAPSAMRTAYLELTFDYATGTISGRILQGRFSGRAITNLTAVERLALLGELRASDPQGAQIYEDYLDRTSPGWKGAPGARHGGERGRPPGRGMTMEEAYSVLGLTPGATRDEVQTAHRNLMKRFHPDQGGSTYLAAQVNEAKDLLLKAMSA